MNTLIQLKCAPCRVGAPTLTETQISKLKTQIPEWDIIEQDDVKKLNRSFKFKDFAQALAFVTKVGEIAEQQGHHPEIQFGWGHATVTWWTHKIGGLHQNDFIMAAKTDQLI